MCAVLYAAVCFFSLLTGFCLLMDFVVDRQSQNPFFFLILRHLAYCVFIRSFLKDELGQNVFKELRMRTKVYDVLKLNTLLCKKNKTF